MKRTQSTPTQRATSKEPREHTRTVTFGAIELFALAVAALALAGALYFAAR